MISKKIHNELRNRFNPDNSDLRNIQMKMLDILIYFDEFCRKNDIKYWLSSGTLLGAVRHSGFIPWDDDMDVEMLPEDYKKLISLRNKFDNDIFILQDKKSDAEYIAPFPKIRNKVSHIKEIHNRDIGYKYNGVFIDIFIRDRASFVTTKISHILQYTTYCITCQKNSFVRRLIKNICYYPMYYFLFSINKQAY